MQRAYLSRWYDAATMAAGPVDLPPPNTAAEAKSSPQTGLLSQTASFATSQLAALTAFFGAIAAAYLSFQKLQSGLGLSVPLCVALVTILLALLFFSHTLPTLLERRRKNRLAGLLWSRQEFSACGLGSAKAGSGRRQGHPAAR